MNSSYRARCISIDKVEEIGISRRAFRARRALWTFLPRRAWQPLRAFLARRARWTFLSGHALRAFLPGYALRAFLSGHALRAFLPGQAWWAFRARYALDSLNTLRAGQYKWPPYLRIRSRLVF